MTRKFKPLALRAHLPCREAIAWLDSQPDPENLAAAWENCPRGDWLWWIARRVAPPPRSVRAEFAMGCAASARVAASTDAASAASAYADAAAAAASRGATAAASYYANQAAAAAAGTTDVERQRQAEHARQLIPNPFKS